MSLNEGLEKGHYDGIANYFADYQDVFRANGWTDQMILDDKINIKGVLHRQMFLNEEK